MMLLRMGHPGVEEWEPEVGDLELGLGTLAVLSPTLSDDAAKDGAPGDLAFPAFSVGLEDDLSA